MLEKRDAFCKKKEEEAKEVEGKLEKEEKRRRRRKRKLCIDWKQASCWRLDGFMCSELKGQEASAGKMIISKEIELKAFSSVLSLKKKSL